MVNRTERRKVPPLRTVSEGRGGNDVAVEVRLAGAKTCRGAPCPIMVYRSNLHRVWDGTLIKATTWSWGAYVDRLESMARNSSRDTS